MYRITFLLIVSTLISGLFCAPIINTIIPTTEILVNNTINSDHQPLTNVNNYNQEVPGQSTADNTNLDNNLNDDDDDVYDPKAFYSLDRFEGDISGIYPSVSN